ncbi:MAG TPA: FecR domain-containing protein [Pedobacter sp.]
MMYEKDAKQLLDKYRSGNCTKEEITLLTNWFHETDLDKDAGISALELEQTGREMWAAIQLQKSRSRHLRLWPRIAAAAAVLLVAAGGYFYFSQIASQKDEKHVYANDIAPGRNSATLTLANGKKIVLADVVNGKIIKEAGVSITKTANGQVVYTIIAGSNAGTSGKPVYNTLSTARGETYQVCLPDSTSVWLNAASSLRYPATFAGLDSRKVELSGEAYFEVAKDKIHPFIVKSTGQEVMVLGTHFNINSYTDEAGTKTTLLEGSVRLSPSYGHSETTGLKPGSTGKFQPVLTRGDNPGRVILKPGEQANLTSSGNISITPVNAEDAIAWKEGYFMFNKESLDLIMIRVARWYNVKVEYEDPSVKTETFFGRISRYEHVSTILNALERTHIVIFKVEGNTIKVGRRTQ